MKRGPTPAPSVVVALAGLLLACEVRGVIGTDLEDAAHELTTSEGDPGPGSGPTSGSSPVTAGGDTSSPVADTSTTGGAAVDTEPDIMFDVGVPDAPHVCPLPQPNHCDGTSDDPLQAMGINCAHVHEDQVSASFTGNPAALEVHSGSLGTHGYFSPREGDKMVILSTGRAQHIALSPAMLCSTCPSTSFGGVPLTTLPDPIDVRPVDERLDCTADPSLVGQGDCSNTIGAEWEQGSGAYDYAELRLIARVPEGFDSLRYQFSFMSAEYPSAFDPASPYNDMYIAWLESEAWTGNISFDEAGNPISINSVLLDFRDAPAPGCAPPCVAPELAGFSMEGHAATRWLETVAPVVEGETIKLVFAIFDMTNGATDSAVVLDDWSWTCSDGPPITSPAP